MPEIICRAFSKPLTKGPAEADPFDVLVARETAHLPLEYAVDSRTKTIPSNPGYDSTNTAHVVGAVVKITGERGYGSGFVTHDKRGDQIIVTTAHMAGECNPALIEMTDVEGNKTVAREGRYVIESNGNFLNPDGNEYPELDVAVLRPADPLGTTSLKLGNLAARSTWLDMVNYQCNAPFDSPFHYKGVVLTSQQGPNNLALTGMEPERKRKPRSRYVVQPGASGSPMVDPQTNEVAGMSFFAGNAMLAPDALEAVNISFEDSIGSKTGVYPRLVHFLDPTYIHKVISSLP